MLRSKYFVQLGLAAALALATPVFAQKGGSSGPSKPEDSPKVDDRGGATAPAPSAPAPAQPDNKGVDPAGKVDDKGVDPAGKADDKGIDTHPDDKGARADDAKPEDLRRFDMGSAPDGERIHARGRIEIRVEHAVENQVERQKERLKVEVEAEVNNGTAFIVWVNGKPAGAVMLRDARGELQLENEPGKAQPAGVFPVREIKNVAVVDNMGALVLRKDF